MVDVSHKAETRRMASARSIIVLGREIIEKLTGDEIVTPKGPVFQTAIIAGTLAVKKTHELIPLCHPLSVNGISFDIFPRNETEVQIDCQVKVSGKTGVEMEALTGASIAALTIYDMCKVFSQEMMIKDTRLIKKEGGKREYEAQD